MLIQVSSDDDQTLGVKQEAKGLNKADRESNLTAIPVITMSYPQFDQINQYYDIHEHLSLTLALAILIF